MSITQTFNSVPCYQGVTSCRGGMEFSTPKKPGRGKASVAQKEARIVEGQGEKVKCQGTSS